jgi:hypothetical protein
VTFLARLIRLVKPKPKPKPPPMTQFTSFPINGELFQSVAYLGPPGATKKRTLLNLAALEPVHIEDFGGAADWNGTSGTDNWGPLMAAVNSNIFTSPDGSLISPPVLFGVGSYFFSQLVQFDTCVRILGVHGFPQGEGTNWIFPAATAGVQFNGAGTTGNTTRDSTGHGRGAQGSTIEGITLRFNGTGTQNTFPAFRMRTAVHIRDCGAWNVFGDAIQIVGSTGSADPNRNAEISDWGVYQFYINGCNRHGIYVDGTDANAGTCYHLHSHGLGPQGFFGGCGIKDTTGIGSNSYIGCQITGYGDNGVFNNGHIFVLVVDDGGNSFDGSGATVGGATTPGTNNLIWQDLGPGSLDPVRSPQWVAGGTYHNQTPVLNGQGSNAYIGLYTEIGAFGVSCFGSGGVAIGGVYFPSFGSHCLSAGVSSGAAEGPGAIGTRVSFSPSTPGHTNNGDFTIARIGSTANGNSDPADGICVFEHWRDNAADGPFPWKFGYDQAKGPDLYYNYLNGKLVWTISTPSTVKKYGRAASSNVPVGTFCLPDVCIGDINGSDDSRIHGTRPESPQTHVGDSTTNHAAGEIYYDKDPSVGTGDNRDCVGWVCTAAGTPGSFLNWGKIYYPPQTYTSNHQVLGNDSAMILNGTGTISLTLPNPSDLRYLGREIMLKTVAAQAVQSDASNVVPLAGGAAGQAILPATAGKWARIKCDGTNWVIMMAN